MKTVSLFISIFMITISCSKKSVIDISKEQEKILELHNAQRDYHFNKDSIAFANQFSDNFIGIGNGIISSSTKEERISRYNKYFSAVEFVKWDDESDPIIKFSDDGSMAYTLVDKIVTLTYKDQKGNEVQEETHFAWTAIYKKYNEEWKIDSVTSTQKPVDIED